MSANNDFYYYEKTKTQDFPEPQDYEDGDALHPDEVDDWFKRCIEDYPMLKDFPDVGNTSIRDAWFYKWFSQFRNNKE